MNSAARPTEKPKNFDEWIMKVMGEGIADVFMRPYNFKVWAVPTTFMQCSWLGERVATVDAKKVIANVLKNEPAAGWGPNAVFRFPREGGTGGIWKSVAKLLPQERQSYSKKIVNIDAENKVAHCEDGSKVMYNKLLSTASLDFMCDWVGKPEMAKGLNYSSTHVIGFGLRGVNPHDLKCWLYYPEDDCPFYRCTVFSHYADKNVPAPDKKLKTIYHGDGSAPADDSARDGPYWSLMLEVSESAKFKPVNVETIVQECLQGCVNTTLMKSTDEVVSVYHRRIERGYPTPCLTRDDSVNEALPYLKSKGIWSRGRFGSWKYEVGNQDHSLMLGVEAVDNMMYGCPEMTLNYPDIVNKKKNEDLRFQAHWNDVAKTASAGN
jgi:protoporphyrinogen oxidase